MNDVVPDFGPAPADPGLRTMYPNSPGMFATEPTVAPPDPALAMYPSMQPPEAPAQPQAPVAAPPAPTVEPQLTAALPETYADLAAPEGYSLNPEAFAPVAAELGKLGVSREQAEGLLGIHAKMEAQLDASVAAENQRWRQEAERALQPGDRQAIAVVMSTAPAEVKQLLGRTGLGNHPALVRWIAGLGRRMR